MDMICIYVHIHNTNICNTCTYEFIRTHIHALSVARSLFSLLFPFSLSLSLFLSVSLSLSHTHTYSFSLSLSLSRARSLSLSLSLYLSLSLSPSLSLSFSLYRSLSYTRTHQGATQAASCEECLAGEFLQGNAADGICVKCAGGSYAAAGAILCINCPFYSVSPVARCPLSVCI